MEEIKFDEKNKIGRYYLENKNRLGYGQQGAVFKAYDLNKNEFAIKEILIENMLKSNENIDKYMIRINHPNIVRYDHLFKSNQYYYIVMELCCGIF